MASFWAALKVILLYKIFTNRMFSFVVLFKVTIVKTQFMPCPDVMQTSCQPNIEATIYGIIFDLSLPLYFSPRRHYSRDRT